MIGGIGLYIGLTSIMLATPMMFGVGVALLFGATLMSAGALALMGVGAMIFAGGLGMYLGGMMLVSAAGLIATGVALLSQSGSGLAQNALQILYGSVILAQAGISLIGAGTLFAIGASALAAAAVILLVGGQVLVPAAIMLTVGGLALTVASAILLTGSQILMLAATTLGDSVGYLETSFKIINSLMPGIAEAASTMSSAGANLAIGASALLLAGVVLRPAAWAIFSGLLWMDLAVSRFSKTIGNVEKVGAAMSLLANSFQVLNKTPLQGLREMSTEALSAIPNIEKLGNGLTVAAKKLDDGVTAFQGPADRLNAILKDLTETISAFGQGLNLTDDVGRLAGMLDKYVNLLENASDRIETAVTTKAIPAMRAAERAGLEETIRSEAISTIQVVDRMDGAARESNDENTKILAEVSTTLVAIDDKLGQMTAGGKGELSEIVAMLQAYLPGINKGDNGLGSELNSWAK